MTFFFPMPDLTTSSTPSTPSTPSKTLVVGGGLAGLACAHKLHSAGVTPLLLEGSCHLGGRVATDAVDGFLLDRGFQVFLTAYPEARKLLKLDELQLRFFRPGALIFRNGKCHRMMDVFRSPAHLLQTALQPIGSVSDKLRVARLRHRLKRLKPDEIVAQKDVSTECYLREEGFTEAMIDGFFRPFYGGIFLEKDLRTSSRMFAFTFRMFAEGYAALPARGMAEIPRQLAAELPENSIRTDAPVRSIGKGQVTLESGERIEARHVVVATDGETARDLVPGLGNSFVGWRSVVSLYFAAPKSPLNEAIIALNGDPEGLVNTVCVPSDVVSDYAPQNQSLVSVSVIDLAESSNLESRVLQELESWFGPEVHAWSHLRTYRIRRALPEQLPGTEVPGGNGFLRSEGIYVCGDHCGNTSIEGAIASGLRVAEEILKS